MGGAGATDVGSGPVAECFVVVPVFDEQKTIEKFMAKLGAVVRTPRLFGVLVIDDGSTDDTSMLLERHVPQALRSSSPAGHCHQ